MDSAAVREEQDSQSSPAAASSRSREMMTGDFRDRTAAAAILTLLKLRREEEELDVKMEERKQLKESLKPRTEELERKTQEVTELRSSFDAFLKDEYVSPEKAEKTRQEGLQKDAEIKRLKEETAQLVERKQEVLRQVERHTPYRDFMERVAKMTKFEDADRLTDHIERLLHLKDQLIQKDSEAQEKIEQQRKKLRMMEDQYRLLQLHKNNQLAQLKTELEEARSETLKWERKWNHIQETAAKKTLLLGQIKMATLNLFEKTEDEGVEINDTEKQLDRIKQFIGDNEDIVKWYQTGQSDGQKRKEQKKGEAKKQNSRNQH